MSNLAQVFSSGGGTQSNAIVALIVQGKLPKPDLGVIVDTGREHAPVWDYFHKHAQPALASVGVTIYRVHKDEYATVDLWGGKEGDTLNLPAYTTQTAGAVGRLSTFCSNQWKVRVKDRFLTDKFGWKTTQVRNWIGFSLDEANRAARMMKGDEYREGRIWFPLVSGIPMRRRQAVKVATEFFGEVPPRSACWMCPNHADSEWINLKNNYPEEFQAAVELEREFQKVDPFAWLHESCVPLDQVDFNAPPSLFPKGCDSGGCML